MVSSYTAMVNAPSLKAGSAVVGTAAAGGAVAAGPAGAGAAAGFCSIRNGGNGGNT
jgi:hypothetical protein